MNTIVPFVTFFPSNHLFFHSGECSLLCMCAGLEWSSPVEQLISQHTMNIYRRQTHPKSPDPPLSSQIWLFCSLPICFMHTHTNTTQTHTHNTHTTQHNNNTTTHTHTHTHNTDKHYPHTHTQQTQHTQNHTDKHTNTHQTQHTPLPHTHTNIFLMSLFLIFLFHPHCCVSSERWRGLSFHLLSLSSSHFIFHLQLISRALLSSHSTIIWHSLFFLSIPIVYPSITKLKRDAAQSWNMYLVYLKNENWFKPENKYPEEKMLMLRCYYCITHETLIVHSVLINLKLKHVFFLS